MPPPQLIRKFGPIFHRLQLGLLLCLGLGSLPGHAQVTISGQRVEHRVAPVGLDVPAPRFSWQLNGPANGLRQTAYQLQVVFDATNGTTMWNSDWVTSDQSQLVPYAGVTLQSSSQYYWRVRVRDQNSAASDWSDWARWVTGYFNATNEFTADWIGCTTLYPSAPQGTNWFNIQQAQWVCHPSHMSNQNGTCLYFKRFVLATNATRVAITAQASTTASLFVNGVEMFQGYNDDPNVPRYLDITPGLKAGTNVLTFRVEETGATHNPGLLVSVRIEQPGGTNFVFSDGSWDATTNALDLWNYQQEQPGDNWVPVNVLGLPGAANTTGQGGATLVLPVYNGTSFMPPSVYLRKEINLPKTVRFAVFHGTAQGLYDLYINGRRLTPTGFQPGWTQFDKHTDYVSTDVTKAVQSGTNALGVVLADGWFRGNLLWMGRENFGTNLWFSGQLEVEYTDGTRDTFRTDSTWKTSYGPLLQSDIMNGEIYDACLEQPGWAQVGFDATGWEPVAVAARSLTSLYNHQMAHLTEPVAVDMELTARSITQPKPGVYVFDFGQNFAGWVRLQVTGSPGQMVYVRMGEDTNLDGTIYTGNLGVINPAQLYICKGGGIEIWEPRFTYCGFRYAQVFGLTNAPDTNTLLGIVAHSGGPITSTFDCSSPLVNRMYQNVVWSQLGNYFEIMTDCPQRSERFGWSGDAFFFMPSAAYNQNDASFFLKKFDDSLDTQKASGLCGNGAPGHGPGAGGNASLDWAAILMSSPWTLWQRFGDSKPIFDNYDRLKLYLGAWQSFADAVDTNGSYRIIGDWLAAEAHPSTAFLGRALGWQMSTEMAAFAKLTGHTNDETTFTNLANHFRDEVTSLHIAADGTATGNRETSYANIGYYGLYTPQQKPAIYDKFQQCVAADGYGVYCGFNGVGKLLPALSSLGLVNEASAVLLNTNYPGWGNTVSLGATTTWETWGAKSAPGVFSGKSMNHFTFAGCGEWLMGYLVGLRPDAPGYKVVHVEPTIIPGLDWVAGSFATPYGTVSNRWEKQAGGISMNLSIPPNSTANVVFPINATNITQQGQPVSGTMINGQMTVSVGSGTNAYFWNINPNTAPTISPVPDTAIYQNTKTNIAFSVWDAETTNTLLAVSATSSNPALVPNTNLVLGGSGWSRSVLITPLTNQIGVSTITLSVSDGTNTTRTSFQFTSVLCTNLPPVISSPPDVTLNAYSSTNLSFTFSDPDTPMSEITLSGDASDPNLMPAGSLFFGGTSTNRTVTLIPSPGRTGSCTVTITVNDGGINASRTFNLNVVTGPDTDGDGMSDGEELWLGRNPSSAADFGFEFNADGDFEGWADGGNVTNTVVANGRLSGATLSSDPQIINTGNLNFPAASVSNLVVKIRASAPGNVQLYWGRVGSSGFSASKTQQVSYNNANAWQICVFPVSTHAQWSNNIINLRVDPISVANKTFDIDLIRGLNGTITAPTIGAVTNQTVYVNAATAPLPFIVGSSWTPASSLTVTGYSPNTNLVPVTNFIFGGISTNRSVIIIPASDQTGVATIQMVVSDGVLSATNSFTLTVQPPPNTPPTLLPIGNQTVNQYSPLTFTTTADDPDLGQTLFFSLDSGAPKGAVITPFDGVFTWTPGAEQGPGVYPVTVRVSDGIASDAATIQITVLPPSNTAPVLATIPNGRLIAGQMLTFSNVASDSDLPPQILNFSLLGAPAGAEINSTNGIFTWRPAVAQSPSSNVLSVVVTDNGTPSLSATQNFVVSVLQPAKPAIGAAGFSNGQFGFSVAGDSGPDYVILVSTNLSTWSSILTNAGASPPFQFTDPEHGSFIQRFYRVILGP